MAEITTTKRRVSTSKPKKPPRLTRKATFVAGWDLAPNATDSKMHGSINPVTRTTLNSSTQIKGGPTVYFKPGKETQYAVASTRLARVLDMESVISHNAFAHINGQDGVVSGQVTGVPLRSLEHDVEVPIPKDYWPNRNVPPNPRDIALWLTNEAGKVVEQDGKYYQLTGIVYNPVDFKDPRIQKGMSDLQLFDAISGQWDRHGGNIYADAKTGKVTGIDDDLSMRAYKRPVDQAFDKYPGLPPLVDRTTAEKILRVAPENLYQFLGHRENDLRDLTPAEIKTAESRLKDVQDYLRQLGAQGGIVDTWDDGTYQRLVQDPTKSYVGLSARVLQGALDGAVVEGVPSKVGPPLEAPPPLPWSVAKPGGVPQPIASNVPSPRPPAIVGTRLRTGAQRLRKEQPDDQQLLDQVDNLPPLPAAPKKLGVSPNSPGRAALSRLASTQLRRAPEKKKEESAPQVDDSGESTSESDITVTPVENDQPTQSAQPIVSPSRPAEPTDIEKRVDALEALLHDLTGGSGNV